MTTRGYWIAILAVALAFIAAIDAGSSARERVKPTAPAALPTAASRPRLAQADAETQACGAARRVVREIAETGRVPDGVPVVAALPSTTESAAEGAVSVAQMPVTEGLQPPPSCACAPASGARDGAWECSASVVRDVHHALYMTFSVGADGARLTRIQSMVGGW